MDKTLVVMAAGLGSRYGGVKQIERLGPGGEILMEYAIYDALQAGFNKIVIIIKPEMLTDVKELFGDRIEKMRIVKTKEEIEGVLAFYIFVSDCVAILAYLLLSIPFAGSVRIIRNIVYNDGVLFKEDFIKGIKMYWKPFILAFGIYGIVRAIFSAIGLFTLNIDDIKISIIIGVVTAFFYVVILPIIYIYLRMKKILQ